MGENSKKISSKDIEKPNGTSQDNPTNANNIKNNDQTQNSSDSNNLSEAMKEIQKHKIEASSKMYDNVSDFTDKYNLGDYVNLSIDPDYQFIQLTLEGSVLFDSGDASIKKEAEPILSRIGDILKRYDGYTIEIEGHTDNVPISSKAFKDNNWLSSARALNAADFLIKTNHMDPKKLKYSGRGEYEPIASNATANGRAKNRRIEIKIYNKFSGR